MSKALDEYEGRKSCAITTARRLAQFLGDERIKDKGLNCNYVNARRPDNLPTSDRAIPVAIFSTEPSVARTYLRKWCGDIAGGEKPAGLSVCEVQPDRGCLGQSHRGSNCIRGVISYLMCCLVRCNCTLHFMSIYASIRGQQARTKKDERA